MKVEYLVRRSGLRWKVPLWVSSSAILPLGLAVKVKRRSVRNCPVPHWRFAGNGRASVALGADARQNPGADTRRLIANGRFWPLPDLRRHADSII